MNIITRVATLDRFMFGGLFIFIANVRGLPPATGGAPPILVEGSSCHPTSTPER